MDTITQGLLGAATAQLGFRQRIGRDATWVAAGAAVVPDLDVLLPPLLRLVGVAGDDMAFLRIHRGLSHSLLFAPVLSLLIALLWWRLRRRWEANGDAPARRAHAPPFALLYACVLVAVFTHPLLDWCTSYGTRLLEPLTDARYAIDAAPIIDLIYTPILILTLVGCRIARRGGRRATRQTLVIGWLGFAASVGYLGAGRLLHDRAVRKGLARLGGEKVVRADAYPAIGSILLWRVVIETDSAWHAVRVHHLSTRPPRAWRARTVAKQTPGPWVERARRLPQYATYAWFAAGRVRAEYERVDGMHVVRFHDMRYAAATDGVESLWPLAAAFNARGQLLWVHRERPMRERGAGEVIGAIWGDLWSP